MSPELIGTVATGVGVLVGVWRLMEAVRRIDNILLADRKPAP